mmetsp:Transcript_5187/g.5178  ORF Transcript_5187/g.5178 Transcript_5187/m.5178 type:complete len:450 (-) Transcript_5187:265-1614(-)
MTGGSPSSLEDHDHHLRKKRVGKACDSCRIKKTKCDGKKPCNRCTLDNKICVFTEKKKVKDKSHPNGYVELLETRLDLLTKSLEKMIQLSRPHLPFLNELTDEDDEENGAIPINRVVEYLIDNEGLLYKVPVEWENGALIAANLEADSKNIKEAARKFYEHKVNVLDKPGRGTFSEDTKRIENPGREIVRNEENGSSEYARVQNGSKVTDNLNEDLSDGANSPTSTSLTEKLNLDDFSLGGYSSNMLLGNAYPDIFSDFESDSNNSVNYAHNIPIGSRSSNGYTTGNGSLFSPISNSNSVTSLTNEFENHGIHSPTSIGTILPTQAHTSLRRSSSLNNQRLFSPSHQKMKNNGHVYKPNHTGGSHSHLNLVYVSNNGNEFHLQKKFSSSSSSAALTPATNTISPDGTKLEEASSLPSDAFKLQNLNYQGLNIMDTENIDSFMISNPFLK